MESTPAPAPESRPLSPTTPQLGTELRDSAVLLALFLAMVALVAGAASVLMTMG